MWFEICLFKAEVVNHIGLWNSTQEIEWETLRMSPLVKELTLFRPIGANPAGEAKEALHANRNTVEILV